MQQDKISWNHANLIQFFRVSSFSYIKFVTELCSCHKMQSCSEKSHGILSHRPGYAVSIRFCYKQIFEGTKKRAFQIKWMKANKLVVFTNNDLWFILKLNIKRRGFDIRREWFSWFELVNLRLDKNFGNIFNTKLSFDQVILICVWTKESRV